MGKTEDRVARGLAFLIERGPEYGFDLDRVSLPILDMNSARCCVLAQAAGTSYLTACQRVPEARHDDDEDLSWDREHGFLSDWSDRSDPVAYGYLDEAWVRAIEAYRAARDGREPVEYGPEW